MSAGKKSRVKTMTCRWQGVDEESRKSREQSFFGLQNRFSEEVWVLIDITGHSMVK
jgi:hypothetical protein